MTDELAMAAYGLMMFFGGMTLGDKEMLFLIPMMVCLAILLITGRKSTSRKMRPNE